jgi:hypothetical protein
MTYDLEFDLHAISYQPYAINHPLPCPIRFPDILVYNNAIRG